MVIYLRNYSCVNVVAQCSRQRKMARVYGHKYSLMAASMLVSFFVAVFHAGANPVTSTKLKEAALEQFFPVDCHPDQILS